MLVREYGLDEWGKLFNDRQLLALTTFARLVGEAHAEMLREYKIGRRVCQGGGYVSGLAVDRLLANRLSTVARWDAGYEKKSGHFARFRRYPHGSGTMQKQPRWDR